MHKWLVWVHPSLPVVLFPLHGWTGHDSDLKQKVEESHPEREPGSPGSQEHCMLPAPAGIDESCSGLETRGQSDLNFVVLSCVKALVDNEASAEYATEGSALQKRVMRLCCPFTCRVCLQLQGRHEHGLGKHQQYSYWISKVLCLAESSWTDLECVQ